MILVFNFVCDFGYVFVFWMIVDDDGYGDDGGVSCCKFYFYLCVCDVCCVFFGFDFGFCFFCFDGDGVVFWCYYFCFFFDFF